MGKDSKVFQSFIDWYSNLNKMKRYGDRPAKGTVAASLVVLERLREKCDLSLETYLAEGGAQIAGLNLSSLRKILARFEETRNFPSEGGRTNRGNNTPVKQLLEAFSDAGLATLSKVKRENEIDRMQKYLVDSLDAYYKLEKLRFEYDSTKPMNVVISEILEKAEERDQAGPVAQHLVGAKLALRFPNIAISNFSTSAADEQSGRSSDFKIHNTTFHVTVAPSSALMQKCKRNISEGFAAFLIVLESKLKNAKVHLEDAKIKKRISLASIETFIGQNLSEMAEFSDAKFSVMLGELLREYNRRIDEVETDSSLLIEIPVILEGEEG